MKVFLLFTCLLFGGCLIPDGKVYNVSVEEVKDIVLFFMQDGERDNLLPTEVCDKYNANAITTAQLESVEVMAFGKISDVTPAFHYYGVEIRLLSGKMAYDLNVISKKIAYSLYPGQEVFIDGYVTKCGKAKWEPIGLNIKNLYIIED